MLHDVVKVEEVEGTHQNKGRQRFAEPPIYAVTAREAVVHALMDNRHLQRPRAADRADPGDEQQRVRDGTGGRDGRGHGRPTEKLNERRCEVRQWTLPDERLLSTERPAGHPRQDGLQPGR